MRVDYSSRQEMLANIEAAGPSSRRGLTLLRELRDREPGNIDTVTRLVSALVDSASDTRTALSSSKRKKQKASKEQQATIARKSAVQEVHAAIRELRQNFKPKTELGADADVVFEDWAALQVRCCALLSDLAQYQSAAKCLDDVVKTLTSSASADAPGTSNAQLHFELARASLHSIERAMRRGEDVFRSQVEPIAQQVRLALAIDHHHKGAMEYEQILVAPPPTGLGWSED